MIIFMFMYYSHLTILETTQRYIIKILFKKPRLFPTELLYEKVNLYNVGQIFYSKSLMGQHIKKELMDHIYNT